MRENEREGERMKDNERERDEKCNQNVDKQMKKIKQGSYEYNCFKRTLLL